MIPTDSQQLESYVPVYDVVPEKWEDARPFLVETLKKMSNPINIREIGYFIDDEILTGQSFIPSMKTITGSSQQFRSVLRMVINFSALPAAGTKSMAHNIFVDENFSLVNMYLAATKQTVPYKAFSLQYWSISTPGDIILYMDAMNVYVTVTTDYSAYNQAYIVIEYIQEL